MSISANFIIQKLCFFFISSIFSIILVLFPVSSCHICHCRLLPPIKLATQPLESRCPSGHMAIREAMCPHVSLETCIPLFLSIYGSCMCKLVWPPLSLILACLAHHGVLSSHSGFEIGTHFTCHISFGNISFLPCH